MSFVLSDFPNMWIKTRTNCVGIFPNDDALMRLIGSILIQQEEDWMDSKVFLKPESFEKHLIENEKSTK